MPLQAPFTFSSGNVHSSIVITIRPDNTSARYSSCKVCHRAMNEVSKRAALSGMVCYDFYKRSGVRCSPQGRNSGPKKRIDLTLRKTLTPRSSESGFHRNVKFATFEEAGRLCKTIPQNGVKVAPLGGRSVPKLPH